jgi:hypothetical protein
MISKFRTVYSASGGEEDPNRDIEFCDVDVVGQSR